MHFCYGDVKTIPSIRIGVKADATHSDTARSKRRLSRESQKEGEISNHQHLSCSSPVPSYTNTPCMSIPMPEPLVVTPAESLNNDSDENFSLLFSESGEFSLSAVMSNCSSLSHTDLQITVNQALVAQN